LNAVKLLIVDDSKAFRDRLRRHLENIAGFEIAGEAANGDAAIAALDSMEPDVILLDLEMPSGNGFAVLRHLESRSRRVPAIVMTNHASYRVRERCLALGAHAVLDKLDVSGRLLPILAELADDRRR
jgi:DNA-binding NarL/FixJ family response regulator